MNIYKERPLYLVADNETGLVYGRFPSATTATAVTFGILNSYSFSLPIQLPHRKTEWDAYDFNKNLYQAERRRRFKFCEFPKELIRDDLLKKRELARLRGFYIHCLEVYCAAQLHRVAEYMPDQLAAFVHSELANCDPSKNIFTRSIEEYAALQEITVDFAYQELQLKLHSTGAVKLRNYAIQQQYMTKMNFCETSQALNDVMQDSFNALVYKAMI